MRRYQTERLLNNKNNSIKNQHCKDKDCHHRSIKLHKPKKINNKQKERDNLFNHSKPEKIKFSNRKKIDQPQKQNQKKKPFVSSLSFQTIQQLTLKYFNKKTLNNRKILAINKIDEQTTLKQLKIPLNLRLKEKESTLVIPKTQRQPRASAYRQSQKQKQSVAPNFFCQMIKQLPFDQHKRNFSDEIQFGVQKLRSKSQIKHQKEENLVNNFIVKEQSLILSISQEDNQQLKEQTCQNFRRESKSSVQLQNEINKNIQQNQKQVMDIVSEKYQKQSPLNTNFHDRSKQNKSNRKRIPSVRFVVNPFQKVLLKSKYFSNAPQLFNQAKKYRKENQNNLFQLDQISIIGLEKDDEPSMDMFRTGQSLLNHEIFEFE